MTVILPQAVGLGPAESFQFCAETRVLPSSGCPACNSALGHRVTLGDQLPAQSLGEDPSRVGSVPRPAPRSLSPYFLSSRRRPGPRPGTVMLGARVWLCRSLLLPRAGPDLATSRRYRRASGLLQRACTCGYPGPGIRALVLSPCPAHTPSYLTPLTPL